jgi:hypothetical protein
MDDFARAVEDGLKLSKRLVLPGRVPPPRPPSGMDRTVSSAAGPDPRLLPTAPTAYAVVTDPGATNTPDVPSYQPYVYDRLDLPALIPLQTKEVDLAAAVRSTPRTSPSARGGGYTASRGAARATCGSSCPWASR